MDCRPSYTDSGPFEPGEVYYYMVRGQNSCGTGSYGNDSAGNERTVGAGDCFHAGLLARLRQRGWLSPQAMAHLDAEALDDLLRYASIAAALNVERAGCDPPTVKQVKAALSGTT